MFAIQAERFNPVTSRRELVLTKSLRGPSSRPMTHNPARTSHIREVPLNWSDDARRLHTVTQKFPKAKYGIRACVSVRPLLVTNEENNGIFLVEYPEGEGTYCIWEEETDEVLRVVWPMKLDDLLATMNPTDCNISARTIPPQFARFGYSDYPCPDETTVRLCDNDAQPLDLIRLDSAVTL